MPLQGALNAIVYGWSLPSIRDVYRTMLLGTDSLDTVRIRHDKRLGAHPRGAYGDDDEIRGGLPQPSPSYSPPDPHSGLPYVGASAPPESLGRSPGLGLMGSMMAAHTQAQQGQQGQQGNCGQPAARGQAGLPSATVLAASERLERARAAEVEWERATGRGVRSSQSDSRLG